RAELMRAKADGIGAVAVVFMHAYRYSDHEKRVAALARELGFPQVSASHEVSPLIKLVGRGDTTVVDAYLSPILRRYVDQVAEELGVGVTGTSGGDGRTSERAVPPHPDRSADAARSDLSPPGRGDAPFPRTPAPRLMFMQSSGGLTDARLFQGKDAILSGPAGGVVAAIETARRAGFGKVIGFDMGGTSTDVSHYDGEYERAFETEVAGVRMRAPMMRIHTVAAGGGSILKFDQGRYRVGPQSAGADPGPACYRRGGPLAVTDANVMVGKLMPEYFPAIFGPGHDQPIDAATVTARFAELAAEIGDGRAPEEIADGFIRIAVANMANAIKKISVQRGYDVTGYALNCFGGAGGQHACLVADTLGIGSVLLHPMSGVLSAYGMGLADIRASRSQAVMLRLSADSRLEGLESKLEEEAVSELRRQGVPVEDITVFARAHLRYEGTDTPIPVTVLERALKNETKKDGSSPLPAGERSRAKRAGEGVESEPDLHRSNPSPGSTADALDPTSPSGRGVPQPLLPM